jgi:flagellar motor switch protein FliG
MAEEAPAPNPNRAPKGSEAAAILLMLLAEDEAAQVLSRLEPDEVQHLGGAMFNVADVSEVQINSVLNTFVDQARARTTVGYGAETQIKNMMERALGSERAENVLARITPVAKSNALEALKWMDPRAIAGMIEGEHPQIAAIVLAHLEPPVAADVLQLLDESIQPDLVYRVATLGPVTAEALEDLEKLLLSQKTRAAAPPPTKRGGAAEAAKIVNNSRTSAEQRIIRALAKLDKGLARTIEDEMFVFDNLLAVDDKGLGTLMRSVENDVLVVALKGADPRLRDKILGCMSSRAAQSIVDEMADRGPIRLAEVQDAQKEILAIARRLASEGTINLGGKDDDYV